MPTFKSQLYLILILLVAAFFRFYHLGSVPPSPSLDEVSIGYNAYSILKTGADEYSTKFPLLLRAYDDWRPALYVYFVLPFIWLLGLTAISVRLPSIMMSLITVAVVYDLTRRLTKLIFTNMNQDNYEAMGLAASLLLAISPWHIYISRLGHEANLGLFTVVLAVYFFIRSLVEKVQINLVASLILFAISLYAYQSQKVITPLLVTAVVVLFLSYWKKHFSSLFWGLLISGLVALPILIVSFEPQAMARFAGTTAFNESHPLYRESQQKYVQAVVNGDRLGILANSRYFAMARIFSQNYLSHWKASWLFSGTLNEQHKVPYLGLLFPWELPLIIIGLFVVLKSIKGQVGVKSFLLIWLLSAPIPASIASQTPHAMRAYTFLPVWQIFGGIGLVYLFKTIVRYINPHAIIAGGCSLIVVSLALLYRNYFIVFPKYHSRSFQYPLAQALKYAISNADRYDKVVISNQNNLYQSYMFYLFFSGYDPAVYQRQGGTKSGGYDKTHQIEKYEFRPIDWPKEKVSSALYVANADDLPPDVPSLFSANLLSGETAIRVVEK